MSINQHPKSKDVVERYPTNTSDAVIREVRPVTNSGQLRNTIFAGIRTKQLEIREGAAHLSDDASPLFISRLAAAVQESIVLTPKITPEQLNRSAIYIDKSRPSVAEYLREVRAATAAIDEKYAQIGGFLGNPITDVEFGGKNYEIPYRNYEHGAIYVTPHGTHEVRGAIYQKYVGLGRESGFLGFPATDEQATTLNTGRFNHFQGGSIYWTQDTGAWSIHGPIRDKWWQMDGERGYLGFPVSDVENTTSGIVSFFQRGSLVSLAGGVIEDHPDSVMFTTQLEALWTKCTTDFGMNSRGEWFFKGHLHNAGFAGNVTTVVTTANFVDAGGKSLVVTAERSLGGTLDTEDRNDDWEQLGTDEFIVHNWDFLRSAGIRTVMKANTTAGDILSILGIGLAVILGAIAGGSKKWCGPVGSQSRDPMTGETTSHVGWQLRDPDQPCPPGYE